MPEFRIFIGIDGDGSSSLSFFTSTASIQVASVTAPVTASIERPASNELYSLALFGFAPILLLGSFRICHKSPCWNQDIEISPLILVHWLYKPFRNLPTK